MVSLQFSKIANNEQNDWVRKVYGVFIQDHKVCSDKSHSWGGGRPTFINRKLGQTVWERMQRLNWYKEEGTLENASPETQYHFEIVCRTDDSPKKVQ